MKPSRETLGWAVYTASQLRMGVVGVGAGGQPSVALQDVTCCVMTCKPGNMGWLGVAGLSHSLCGTVTHCYWQHDSIAYRLPAHLQHRPVHSLCTTGQLVAATVARLACSVDVSVSAGWLLSRLCLKAVGCIGICQKLQPSKCTSTCGSVGPERSDRNTLCCKWQHPSIASGSSFPAIEFAQLVFSPRYAPGE